MFAGIRHFELAGEHSAARSPMVVLYPTTAMPVPVKVGPYLEELSADARMASGQHLLAIISHGSGGSHLAYLTLAADLARNGFVVALPEHPGNNRNDNRLGEGLENLRNRPRHIRLAIDAVLADAQIGPHVGKDSVAMIGHSMGGYTALAVAGGVPRFPPGSNQVVDVEVDPRVKALVLMAPATPWYLTEGSLARVTVPILMFTAEHDPYTPPWQSEIVSRGIPDASLLSHRRVANAGHFSFLSPFPAAMCVPGFLPAVDPEGFDRAAFQSELGEEVRLFLRRFI